MYTRILEKLNKLNKLRLNHFNISTENIEIKAVFRGTRGLNSPFSNPDALKEAGGFYSRGKNDTINLHRYEANSSIYIPTSLFDSIAASFAMVGWVHMIQNPEISIFIPKIHSLLPPLAPDGLDQKIGSEFEVAAVKNIPWSDVILSRQVISCPGLPLNFYFGDTVKNPDFKLRNYSCEIFTASDIELKFIQSLQSEEAAQKNKLLSLEDAENITGSLSAQSLLYDINNSTSAHLFVGPSLNLETVNPNKSVEVIICNQYDELMKENNIARRDAHISFASARTLFNAEAIKKETIKEVNEEKSSPQLKK